MSIADRFSGVIFVAQVVGLACLLGIAIDLVTANVAVEYFTVHHPRVVESKSPWVMAFVWGIGASWWCGLVLAPFMWIGNKRRQKPLSRRRLLVMVAKAMATMWLIMMLVLLVVYLVAGVVPLDQRQPNFESDRRLMAVAMAHLTEYALAVVMTVVLCFRIRRVLQ